KSFPVQDDPHYLVLCRYIERNALRAGLVDRAERWVWSSLFAREQGRARSDWPRLADWPVQRPSNWVEFVNQPQTLQEEQAILTSIRRGKPFGDATWQKQAACALGLELTLRPRGRPKQERKRPHRV